VIKTDLLRKTKALPMQKHNFTFDKSVCFMNSH